ncbi:MAG TPA: response regulator transcription factor [Microlunatus sp.]|nr:response regulator transcription factor [Microlunatus sp.]
MQPGLERKAVIIEDDADVRNLLVAILHEAGFSCVATPNGLEGINAVREHRPILTTLDVSLPGIDGFEVARRIRSFSTTYVIMLSARNEEIDTLMGLDAGADDYLTKPFRPRELRARIEAMLRRLTIEDPVATGTPGAGRISNGPAEVTEPSPSRASDAPQERADDDLEEGWLHHNGLRINSDMWLCSINGAPVELTRSEFDLLLALMEGRRRVITKDSLALELRGGMAGGYVSDADRRAVEVHIANLRRKLNDPVSSPRFIETVRGVGYRLAEARTH